MNPMCLNPCEVDVQPCLMNPSPCNPPTTVCQPGYNDWADHLCKCACFECCTACLFPCCFAAYTARQLGFGPFCACLQFFCYPCGVCLLRGDTRDYFNIYGSTLDDCITACCCPCCVLVQLRSEHLAALHRAMEQVDPMSIINEGVKAGVEDAWRNGTAGQKC